MCPATKATGHRAVGPEREVVLSREAPISDSPFRAAAPRFAPTEPPTANRQSPGNMALPLATHPATRHPGTCSSLISCLPAGHLEGHSSPSFTSLIYRAAIRIRTKIPIFNTIQISNLL